jgi:hypothetical protein
VVDGGGVAGLVSLLESDVGERAEFVAAALRNIANGSERLKQAVVNAGGAAALK